jgi:Uma2 family endonuclease
MAVETEREPIDVPRYLKLKKSSDVKHEYVDGYIYAMAGGTRNHARLTARAIQILGERLEGTECVVYSPNAHIRVNEQRYFYADATAS